MPWVVARELADASVDLHFPVRPDLIKDSPMQLLNIVSKGARAGVEDGSGGRRGEASCHLFGAVFGEHGGRQGAILSRNTGPRQAPLAQSNNRKKTSKP